MKGTACRVGQSADFVLPAFAGEQGDVGTEGAFQTRYPNQFFEEGGWIL